MRGDLYLRNPSFMGNLLQFSGHDHLRHRLVLSVLSGKQLRIDKIRPDDKNPGLRGSTVPSTRFGRLLT